MFSFPALHLAAQCGSSGCVISLLDSGADPNLVDNVQQTPLFPAVEGGHSKCIKAVSLLIQLNGTELIINIKGGTL